MYLDRKYIASKEDLVRYVVLCQSKFAHGRSVFPISNMGVCLIVAHCTKSNHQKSVDAAISANSLNENGEIATAFETRI